MSSFSETSENIAISHIAKIDTLDYIYRYMLQTVAGLSSTTFT